MQRDLAYVLDIFQSAQMIQEFVRQMDETAFQRDMKTQDAVIRRIEVIGEATRRLTMEYRAGIPKFPGRLWPGCEAS